MISFDDFGQEYLDASAYKLYKCWLMKRKNLILSMILRRLGSLLKSRKYLMTKTAR